MAIIRVGTVYWHCKLLIMIFNQMRDPWQEGMQGDGTSRGTYSSPGAQFAVFECARDSFNKISR